MKKFTEFLAESMDDEFVLGALADKDINGYIDGKTIFVDADDVKEAQKIVKKIGCKKTVKAGK